MTKQREQQAQRLAHSESRNKASVVKIGKGRDEAHWKAKA